MREVYQEIVATNQAQLMKLLTEYSKEVGAKINKAEIKELASIVLASIEGCYQLATTASELMPSDFAAKTLKRLVHSFT